MKHALTIIISLTILFSCSNREPEKKTNVKNTAYDQAFTYRENGEGDSAFIYFDKAKDIFLHAGDNFGAGKCLLNMAIISTDNGDNFGGQELSLTAQKYFNLQDKTQHVFIRSNLNNLGIASYKLKDYKNSLAFYDAAIHLSIDSPEIRLYVNNKARIYQETRDYTRALILYKMVLSGTNKNPIEYARTLSNIAKTKWLQNPKYNAEKEFLKALKIRELEHDSWGLNASYAHLSDYYAETAPTLALVYANKMYHIAKINKSVDDRLLALQKLIKLSPNIESKQYFRIYEALEDSITTVRNAAKNQFALIRFETEKNKTSNLILQKDNQAKKYQLIILISISLFLLFLGVFWYIKRKQKMTLETQNAIRQSQLQTSKKVHDVVANGLYRIMSEMENQDYMDKDAVLDRIEELYEKSRDISYEDSINNNKPCHSKIAAILKSFATENTHISIAGNSEKLWEKISPTVFYEVEHIIQELMVNMKKHSQADKVGIRFERSQSHLHIFYTDNGVGMPQEIKFNNGLRNTGNRINGIDGIINFDNKQGKGLKIEISFPVV